MEVNWVVQAGAVELAFGALSGWIMTLMVERPEVLRRAGVKAMARVRQAHLDYIIMGVILIALGLAAPGLDRVWQVLLVVGAWVNPTLFVPLAFRPETQQVLLYRAITGASFVCMSAGTVASAVYLLGR
jgi:hydroxylaminobenzene mutase